MHTYNVFITTSQYELVEADTAEQAQMIAYHRWKRGEIDLTYTPEFICEEADREPQPAIDTTVG